MKTFKILWKLFKYKPWLYIVNIVVWTIVELIPLIPTLIIKEILDSFTSNSDLNTKYWWLIGSIVIVYLVRIIFTYLGNAAGVLYAFNIKGLLRHNLLKGILSYPGAQALNISPSEAINRFRDDVEEVNEMITWPVDVFNKMVGAVIAVVILIKVNANMTFLVIAPLFVVLIAVQQIRKKVYKYREVSREATSRAVGAMGEMFSSIQAIKVANAEEYVINHLSKLNKLRHDAMIKDTLFVKLIDSILSNIVHIGTGLILLLSAKAMKSGNFSIGDFALFIGYWFIVADFSDNFGSLVSAYHQGKVSLKRLVDLLYKSEDIDLVNHENIHLIGKLPKPERGNYNFNDELIKLEVKDLSYSYNELEKGIKDVNFELNKGTFTVITGRVGSGKSTLLKCMLGLLPSDNGNIYWNDNLINNPSHFFVPPRVGYTSQIPHLFSDTVKNNISLGLYSEKENIDEAIKSSVFEQDLNDLEDGLNTVIGPRGVKLSGGQIQRVAAARMFATKSNLYIFDDISSALDVETENILWSRLFKNKNATCIAVSNRKTALQMANQIIVMKDGKIISKGTLEELLEICEEFQQIYQHKEIVTN